MKFKPVYRVALRRSLKDGLITQEEYDTAMKPLRWPVRRDRVSKKQVRILDKVRDFCYEGMEAESIRIDWSKLIIWIKANWSDILKFIVTLLIFLEPPPQER